MNDMDLFEKFKATIVDHRLISNGDTVIVAVSGGADSTALLHLLASLRDQWNLTLVVAHLDHRLRVDSADDARFVLRMAAELGVAPVTDVADVRGLARRRKRSIEEAGREARYEFLERVAREHGARRIATAHTQDDQIETVLMRILRGDPWDAQGGIPIVRPLNAAQVIRPLLMGAREEVRRYLAGRSIEWREDPSNRDVRFDRNWIRLRVLPDLERLTPGVRELLLGFSSAARRADYLLNELAHQHAANVAEAGEHMIRIPLPEFRRHPQDVQRRMLRWAASQITGTTTRGPAGWEKRAHQAATQGRAGDVVDGAIAVRVNYDALEVARPQSQKPSREYRLK
ncbi:MAG TPA: tRNA lysidine(34) synthetase TilS, partial [bacterium]|nr:tRNA lysidine(34) synthetase TilS [bacterium]